MKHGYVSVCNRPVCVPPGEEYKYDFDPRPLEPLPPVPPEIFIHYLQDHDFEPGSNGYVWAPRLPKRIENRIIDCEIPTYGWGIYIREGISRWYVLWTTVAAWAVGLLVCIVWTSVKADIQGGSGVGALIITLLSVVMPVFMLPRYYDN